MTSSRRDWLGISDVVRVMRERKPPPAEMPARERAAMLALDAYPAQAMSMPELVNFAALSLAMPRLEVHQVTGSAAELVHATDLHSLPSEPPRLLRRPWILEARRPERGNRLFGSTVCLAGYDLDGVYYLIGLTSPDGCCVARWTPEWTGGELDEGVQLDTSPLIQDVDAHHEWSLAAARFLVVLGVLLDAEGSPVVSGEPPGAKKRRGRKRGSEAAAADWVERRIYVDDPAMGSSGGGSGTGAQLGDRIEADVEVRGHIKRQPHGPGGKERKLIYVRGYQARRWVSPKPLRWVVGTTN